MMSYLPPIEWLEKKISDKTLSEKERENYREMLKRIDKG